MAIHLQEVAEKMDKSNLSESHGSVHVSFDVVISCFASD
jgi:hypothetical protein